MLSSKDFITKATQVVYELAEQTFDVTDNVKFTLDNVYVVWSCFILGNQKALLSTTLTDGKYYEVTYNANTDQMYVDQYVKVQNKTIDNVTNNNQ